MKALLLGATGMVGGEVLRLCLDDGRVREVVSVGRRLAGPTHPKLVEVQHADFLDFEPIADRLAGVDLCLYCLGVYQNDVPKDVFWRITCDYQSALVHTLERVSPDLSFCLFGAQGASPNERSLFRFANAKGRAERMLFEANLRRKYVFRPGYIHPSRPPDNGRRSYAFFVPIYRLFPFTGIDAIDLARVMVEVGLSGSDRTVFENRHIRSYARTWRSRKVMG
jgi:uncharacterized protein YbjT (DUF2867 family)